MRIFKYTFNKSIRFYQDLDVNVTEVLTQHLLFWDVRKDRWNVAESR